MVAAADTKLDALDRAVAIGIARGAAVSESALLVLGVLRRLNATAPDRAVPDHEISREARVPCRNVIGLVEELVVLDVAVLATCGKGREEQRGKGRFICTNPQMVREYAEKLHKRAKSIHGRAGKYRDLAERMDAKRMPVDSMGQGRLNYA